MRSTGTKSRQDNQWTSWSRLHFYYRRQVRGHLLMKMLMNSPDYDNAIKTVEEDFYRNVFIDNEHGDLNAFKGSTSKEKGSRPKAKDRMTTTEDTTVQAIKEKAKESAREDDHTRSKEE
eukprot:2657636-Amphidinium_carterae.5